MPSWNIHIAHVEQLLQETSPEELGVRDLNCFLFGNLVPDVPVGYMVAEPKVKIAYKDTHLSEAVAIPTPDASAFYRRFVQGQEPSDLTLGAWCHLICDHYYNARTVAYIASIGVEAGDATRAAKQADFNQFGRTLEISSVPVLTEELLAECAAFPHYAVPAEDVREALSVTAGIVERNRTEHIEHPRYTLLTERFFADTYAEVAHMVRTACLMHAAGEDASAIGRP